MLRVQYLGNRESRNDSLFGTNAVWRGHRDVQPVEEDAKARRMCNLFPEMFRLVGDAERDRSPAQVSRDRQIDAAQPAHCGIEAAEPLLDGKKVPIEEASWKALAAYAESIGLRVPGNIDRQELIADIQTASEEPGDPQIQTQAPESPEDFYRQTAEELAHYLAGVEDDNAKPTVSDIRKEKWSIDYNHLNAKVRDEAWEKSRKIRRRRLRKMMRDSSQPADSHPADMQSGQSVTGPPAETQDGESAFEF